MTYPTPSEAEQAATLLGMDVFDLAIALRCFSEDRFRDSIGSVRDYEMPNFGRSRRAMGAAIACDSAWRMVIAAAEESVPVGVSGAETERDDFQGPAGRTTITAALPSAIREDAGASRSVSASNEHYHEWVNKWLGREVVSKEKK